MYHSNLIDFRTQQMLQQRRLEQQGNIRKRPTSYSKTKTTTTNGSNVLLRDLKSNMNHDLLRGTSRTPNALYNPHQRNLYQNRAAKPKPQKTNTTHSNGKTSTSQLSDDTHKSIVPNLKWVKSQRSSTRVSTPFPSRQQKQGPTSVGKKLIAPSKGSTLSPSIITVQKKTTTQPLSGLVKSKTMRSIKAKTIVPSNAKSLSDSTPEQQQTTGTTESDKEPIQYTDQSETLDVSSVPETLQKDEPLKEASLDQHQEESQDQHQDQSQDDQHQKESQDQHQKIDKSNSHSLASLSISEHSKEQSNQHADKKITHTYSREEQSIQSDPSIDKLVQVPPRHVSRNKKSTRQSLGVQNTHSLMELGSSRTYSNIVSSHSNHSQSTSAARNIPFRSRGKVNNVATKQSESSEAPQQQQQCSVSAKSARSKHSTVEMELDENSDPLEGGIFSPSRVASQKHSFSEDVVPRHHYSETQENDDLQDILDLSSSFSLDRGNINDIEDSVTRVDYLDDSQHPDIDIGGSSQDAQDVSLDQQYEDKEEAKKSNESFVVRGRIRKRNWIPISLSNQDDDQNEDDHQDEDHDELLDAYVVSDLERDDDLVVANDVDQDNEEEEEEEEDDDIDSRDQSGASYSLNTRDDIEHQLVQQEDQDEDYHFDSELERDDQDEDDEEEEEDDDRKQSETSSALSEETIVSGSSDTDTDDEFSDQDFTDDKHQSRKYKTINSIPSIRKRSVGKIQLGVQEEVDASQQQQIHRCKRNPGKWHICSQFLQEKRIAQQNTRRRRV